jgi:hypothetical protein
MAHRRIAARFVALWVLAIAAFGSPAAAAQSSLPSINQTRPASGSIAGGSTVTIDGAFLDTVTSVTFGGTAATIVARTPTVLTVTAPSHVAGVVGLTVVNPGGSASSAGAFTYVNDDSVARDYSVAANPSPRWSYGWEPRALSLTGTPTPGAAFTLYTTSYPGGFDQWSSGSLPTVLYNPSSAPLNVATNTTPAGGFGLHPGVNLEYSVARWTAPASGLYHVAGFFAGSDFAGPTTTDVWVLHNNNAVTPLFSGAIASYNVPLNFSFDVTVAVGDTIEFAVGPGPNDYGYDQTQLDATISPLAVTPPTPPPGGLAAYTMTGTATGTLNGIAFTNAAVTVQGIGDPALITQVGGVFCNTLSSLSFNISGTGAGIVTDPFGIFGNPSVQAVGFERGIACASNDWLDIYHSSFASYQLGMPIGPVTGTPLIQGTVNTSAGLLVISSSAISTFQVFATAGPRVMLTPPALAFPARTLLTASSPLTSTLTNIGAAPLTIASITASGDFAFTSNCGASLPPGGTCDIVVTFTPLAEGARTGAVTLATNAPGSPHVLALSGTGQPALVPGVLVTPPSLDFAARIVGTESDLEYVTVANDGTAPLEFAAIAATGDFATSLSFSSAHGPCLLPIAPGAACEIGVAFRPSASGLREGTLRIDSNAALSPTLVHLVGTGLDAVPARALTVPASLAFATQRMGTRSAGLSIDVVNNLATPATITELSATGDFSVSDTCTTIAPRGHCAPLVFFRPTALGARSGALTIRTLSDTLPYSVTLSGTGLANPLPSLAVSVARVGFGNSFLGSVNTADIVLSNLGQVPVVFASFTLIGDYLVSNPCGASLAVGASCTVQVTFLPTTPGARSGALEIRSNAEGSPHSVEFSGVGCTIPSMTRARLGAMRCGS